MDEAIAVHLRIEGRVQGVGYRYWTMEQARARRLAGWVRNRRDGSVEALIAGPAALVAELVAACRTGPPGARVTQVLESKAEPPRESGFRQLPTA
jgi:acylphosphatase